MNNLLELQQEVELLLRWLREGRFEQDAFAIYVHPSIIEPLLEQMQETFVQGTLASPVQIRANPYTPIRRALVTDRRGALIRVLILEETPQPEDEQRMELV